MSMQDWLMQAVDWAALQDVSTCVPMCDVGRPVRGSTQSKAGGCSVVGRWSVHVRSCSLAQLPQSCLGEGAYVGYDGS